MICMTERSPHQLVRSRLQGVAALGQVSPDPPCGRLGPDNIPQPIACQHEQLITVLQDMLVYLRDVAQHSLPVALDAPELET